MVVMNFLKCKKVCMLPALCNHGFCTWDSTKALEAKLGFALKMAFLFPRQCILTFIYIVLSPRQVRDDLEATQA